jgi:hypothetical protein
MLHSVKHFSNFGVLFGVNYSDDWTLLEKLSLGLCGGAWVLLIVFFSLVLFSASFRKTFRLQGPTEKLNEAMKDLNVPKS